MTTCGFVIDYDELGTIQEEALEPIVKRGYGTWGDSFRAALSRGEDRGRAAFIADEWEKRQSNLSKNGFVICEWCGTDAWVPSGDQRLSCDCNRTTVLKSNPTTPITAKPEVSE